MQQTLINTNKVLDNLIEITQKDIEDIKEANHEPLFQRNTQKEELIEKFSELKSQIDSILVSRSESGLDIKDLISPEEDKLLDEFRTKLKEFYDIHKRFAKMAFSVTHFYNNLMNRINNCEPDIGYEMNQKQTYPNLSLKV